MKDTYRKRTYKCKCGTLNEEYLWDSKLDSTQVECTKCGNFMGIKQIKVDKVVSFTSIRTPTKNR